MAERKDYTHEVIGISEIQQELTKMNADSKRNSKITIVTAGIAFLTLLATILTLFK